MRSPATVRRSTGDRKGRTLQHLDIYISGTALALVLALAAVLVLVTPVAAQEETQFTPVFSTERKSGDAVAWGDMDGDGDLDAAVGYGWLNPPRYEIWRNDDGATTKPTTTIFDDASSHDLIPDTGAWWIE